MKKKNKAFILFFASPAFQSSFDPANPKCFRLVFDAYKKFFAEYGHQRNDDLFTECYELIVGAFGCQVARLRRTKHVRFSTPATRGKSWVQSQLENIVDDKVKVATDLAEGKLLEIEWELAACQAKIKSLEEQPRNKEEQIVGKVSVWKQCIPWCDDRPGVAYQDYLEWCKDRNLKPVSPHEFEKQMGDE